MYFPFKKHLVEYFFYLLVSFFNVHHSKKSHFYKTDHETYFLTECGKKLTLADAPNSMSIQNKRRRLKHKNYSYIHNCDINGITEWKGTKKNTGQFQYIAIDDYGGLWGITRKNPHSIFLGIVSIPRSSFDVQVQYIFSLKHINGDLVIYYGEKNCALIYYDDIEKGKQHADFHANIKLAIKEHVIAEVVLKKNCNHNDRFSHLINTYGLYTIFLKQHGVHRSSSSPRQNFGYQSEERRFNTEYGTVFNTNYYTEESHCMTPYGNLGGSTPYTRLNNDTYKYEYQHPRCPISAITEWKGSQLNNHFYIIIDDFGGLWGSNLERNFTIFLGIIALPKSSKNFVNYVLGHDNQTNLCIYSTESKEDQITVKYVDLAKPLHDAHCVELHLKIKDALNRECGISHDDFKYLKSETEKKSYINFLMQHKVTIFQNQAEIKNAEEEHYGMITRTNDLPKNNTKSTQLILFNIMKIDDTYLTKLTNAATVQYIIAGNKPPFTYKKSTVINDQNNDLKIFITENGKKFTSNPYSLESCITTAYGTMSGTEGLTNLNYENHVYIHPRCSISAITEWKGSQNNNDHYIIIDWEGGLWGSNLKKNYTIFLGIISPLENSEQVSRSSGTQYCIGHDHQKNLCIHHSENYIMIKYANLAKPFQNAHYIKLHLKIKNALNRKCGISHDDFKYLKSEMEKNLYINFLMRHGVTIFQNQTDIEDAEKRHRMISKTDDPQENNKAIQLIKIFFDEFKNIKLESISSDFLPPKRTAPFLLLFYQIIPIIILIIFIQILFEKGKHFTLLLSK